MGSGKFSMALFLASSDSYVTASTYCVSARRRRRVRIASITNSVSAAAPSISASSGSENARYETAANASRIAIYKRGPVASRLLKSLFMAHASSANGDPRGRGRGCEAGAAAGRYDRKNMIVVLYQNSGRFTIMSAKKPCGITTAVRRRKTGGRSPS